MAGYMTVSLGDEWPSTRTMCGDSMAAVSSISRSNRAIARSLTPPDGVITLTAAGAPPARTFAATPAAGGLCCAPIRAQS